ncbi:MAG: DUF1491 family protein [Hyphomicrobiaceae bacterium]|nr:DUF1491 family protein [Hyphomicrobiaceae bacterium]
MRLKTEIWVKAYLRYAMSEGIAGYVATSGDDFAGAIYIHIDDLDGSHYLFGPAPAGLAQSSDERHWVSCFPEAPVTKEQADTYLLQQKKYDPDLWIVELEDKQGRHFLGDFLVE